MRINSSLSIVVMTALVAACLERSVHAADDARPAAKPASSLDDQLLKDLDNDLLDDVGGLKKTTPKPSPAKPAGDKPAPDKPGEPAQPDSKPDQPLLPPPGEDIGQEEEEPLARIAREMRTVESLIQQRSAHEATSERQKQIVADLTKLLEQLEQQQQKQSQSQSKSQQQTAQRQQIQQPGSSQPGNKPSDKPAQDSSAQVRKNEVQRPDMGQMQGLMKDLWGQLPERAREQMLQTSPEQFLPKYELLIEQYYKRLAEQQERK